MFDELIKGSKTLLRNVSKQPKSETLLEPKRASYSCISFSIFSRNFGPKYEMLSKPLRTVLFLGTLKKRIFASRYYFSVLIFGARSSTTLNISTARNRRFFYE